MFIWLSFWVVGLSNYMYVFVLESRDCSKMFYIIIIQLYKFSNVCVLLSLRVVRSNSYNHFCINNKYKLDEMSSSYWYIQNLLLKIVYQL